MYRTQTSANERHLGPRLCGQKAHLRLDRDAGRARLRVVMSSIWSIQTVYAFNVLWADTGASNDQRRVELWQIVARLFMGSILPQKRS